MNLPSSFPWRPGLAVMSRLQLPAKLLVIGLTAFAPSLALVGYALRSLADETALANAQTEGLARVRALDGQIDALLATPVGSGTGADALARLAVLRPQREDIAESSRLSLAPDAATFALSRLALDDHAVVAPAIADVRRLGARLLESPLPQAGARGELLGAAHSLETDFDQMQARMAALARAGEPAPPGWGQAREAVERLVAQARRLAEGEEPGPSAAGFAMDGRAAAQGLHRIGEDVLDAWHRRLTTHAHERRGEALFALAALAAGALAALYFALAFQRSHARRLAQVRAGIDAITGGDLSHRVETSGADELARLGAQVDHMAGRLSVLVAEIRSGAVRVGQAGQVVAFDGHALSMRTESQATGLRESLQTVEQLSAGVRTTARAASELGVLTADLARRSEQGGHSMRETVEAITELESRVRRVAEINGVIDDIAYQTNLLALNAAVEAARAGESGKGFAVVANEVRQLALRCASAAGEIRELIEQTNQQATESSERIRVVSRSLDAMGTGVKEVAARLENIAGAAVRQSQGLENVTATVGQLDALTQENARSVTHSAHASQALVSQAAALGAAVCSVRLRQGSADEARALVERALERVAEIGMDAALAEFNDPDGEFIDRDLYVFALDRDGRFLAHGRHPAYVGELIGKVQSVIAFDRFLDQSFAAAQGGGDWVDYELAEGTQGGVALKSAFVQRLAEQAVVGCGIYGHQGSQRSAAAALQPAETAAQ